MRPLLFFDLDDTLVDHHGAEARAHRELHEAHASVFGGVPYEAWLDAYRRSNLALWERYGRGEIDRATLSRRRFTDPLAALGLDEADGAWIGDRYMEAYGRNWSLVEGAEEVLAHAARFGVAGILSNGFVETQRGKIARFRLDRWVKHVVLSEEVGAMKPSRAIFDAAFLAAGAPAGARRVYVGDSFATDVLGAKAAGWFPVWFDRHGAGPPEPVVYVRRLADLLPLLS
ncbi:MAG TPA: HAD-IA family hydrolase [Thermoanaerobaculia bacterium]|nr:HAD-IA family hydrolase [Thermoanaerobaculia bacterium]